MPLDYFEISRISRLITRKHMLFSRNIKLQFTFDQHYQKKDESKDKEAQIIFRFGYRYNGGYSGAYLIQQQNRKQ